jgi:hypothetical protein
MGDVKVNIMAGEEVDFGFKGNKNEIEQTFD